MGSFPFLEGPVLKKYNDYFVIDFDMDDEYNYGLFYDQSRLTVLDAFNQAVAPVSIYKMDMSGNVIRTNKFVLDRPSFPEDGVVTLTKKGIYFTRFDETAENGDSISNFYGYVFKYDKELNFVNKDDLNKIKTNSTQYLNEFSANNNYLIYNLCDQNDNEYYSTVDFDDQLVHSYSLLKKDVFTDYYSKKSIYTGDKIIQEFISDDGKAIFAFYETYS